MANQKLTQLKEAIAALDGAAVAFSSGVDSTLLLAVAHDVLGDRCLAITAASDAAPAQDLAQARAFCEQRGIRQVVFDATELQAPAFAANQPDRCYWCKLALFERMGQIAQDHGLSVILDGTNVDDLSDVRPGLRALEELGVVSPLAQAGLTKAQVREISRELGLATWNKPSAACLASRIPFGEPITASKLRMVADAEQALAREGFVGSRVRAHGKLARLEVAADDIERLASKELRCRIAAAIHAAGFTYVTMDLDGYRMGSLNEVGHGA